MGRKKSLTSRVSRNKDKQRKRKYRQQIQSYFHFLRVDTAWKNFKAVELGLPAQDESTAADESISSTQLLPPTVFHRTLPDGNCFFNALSYVITGHQHFQHVIRRAVCTYISNHRDELRTYVPLEYNGNVDEYLLQSGMENNKTWATEVEIFAAANLLNTTIFVYTQHGVHWTWLRHAPRQSDTDRGIYLYHRGLNHYDVVIDIGNNSVNLLEERKLKKKLTNRNMYAADGINIKNKARTKYQTHPFYRETKRRKEKDEYDNDPVKRNSKKQRQKQVYDNDPIKRDAKKQKQKQAYDNDPIKRDAKKQKQKQTYDNDPIKRDAKKQKQKQAYDNDPIKRDAKKQKQKQAYDNDPIKRDAKKQKQKQTYDNDPIKRDAKKQKQKQTYDNDPIKRDAKKQKQKQAYDNDPIKRDAKKQKQKQIYDNDPIKRDAKKQKQKQIYDNDPIKRDAKKQKQKQTYCNDPIKRDAKKQKQKVKYTKDSVYRNITKKKAKERYDTNKAYRIYKRTMSVKKYATNSEFRYSVRHYAISKYKQNSVFKDKVKQYSQQMYRDQKRYRELKKDKSKTKYREMKEFRQATKEYSKTKYRERNDFRQAVKEYSKTKYRQNNSFRAILKAASIRRYASNPLFRNRLKCMLRQQYDSHKDIQSKKKEAVNIRRKKFSKVLQTFRKNINDTPGYVCTVCVRKLCRNQVKACNRTKYMENNVLNKIAGKCLTGDYRYNSKEWICKTCDSHLSVGNMPPQALANGLTLLPIPDELKRLNSLEKQLIALRIPFMKLLSLPRGGQRGVKGQVVNVPSNLNSVTTSLPRTVDNAQMIKVKLKRKLSYKGYQQYEWINPNNVFEAVKYLIANNIWYSDITLNSEWFDNICDSDIVQTEDQTFDSDIEEHHKQSNDPTSSQPNMEHSNKTSTEETLQPHPTETCSQPLDLGQEYLDTNNKIFCVAPGENQIPQSIFQEKGADSMAFPVAHPDGNFGFSYEREIKLSPSKYFNTRLFCADERFAKKNQYIFYAQFMVELYNIKSNISVAMRKGRTITSEGKKVTASTLTNADNLQQVLKSDTGFRFLQPVRGTPPYWQRTMKDLYAMIRQLGIPTWFVTFSAAETRWDEVMEVLKGEDKRDVQEIEWTEKCKLIKENPVMCARLFNNRVKCLFTDLIMSPARPLGEVVDFFYRTEFQQRGSPHIHCLLWVRDAPKLDNNTDEEICNFVDEYISCKMPDINQDQELHEIVATVQMHSKSHTKSCKKNSNTCRFKFPRPPIKQTFIARTETQEEPTKYIPEKDRKLPTAEEFNDICSKAMERSAKEIVKDVWRVINTVQNIEEYTINDIVQSAGVTYSQFVDSLKAIATRSSIYHKRNLTESWINNYNPLLLHAWNANMDIQYVMDPYSCVAYILSYISKSESEIGQLLSDAKTEAREGNKDAAAAMKKIGQVYIQNREVSAQEAVYRVCGMHLKESSRQVVFVPTGSNAVKMSLPISNLRSKKEDSENIWMSSVIDKYYARPQTDEFENMCLGEFCSHHTIHPKSRRPKQSKAPGALPVFELLNQFGFIKRRRKGKEAVIRYPRFNRLRNPDEYYLSLLQIYMPHRDSIVKPSHFKDFEEYVKHGTKNDLPLLDLITEKRKLFELDADDLERAWEDVQEGRIGEDAWSLIAPEAEAERLLHEQDKELPTNEEGEENSPDLDMLGVSRERPHGNVAHVIEHQHPKTSLAEIKKLLRIMNKEQQRIFYKVREWALQVAWKKHPEPFHLFVTGGAGTGKSHLIKCVHHDTTRILSKTFDFPDAVPVVLTAPTGTAAFNIGGKTLHSAFSINKNIRLPYTPLGESILNTLRTKYDSLQLVIIDEVSMVDHKLLSYVHGRLSQIKQSKKYFGNVAILAVGDFYQLPPIRASPLYKLNNSIAFDLWNPLFTIATLTEVMRQREDAEFAAMLNRLRIHPRGEPFLQKDIDMLTSVSSDSVPSDVKRELHIFSTNKEVAEHNDTMVSTVCSPCISCYAKDYTRDTVTGRLVQRDPPFCSTSQEDLLDIIKIGKGARIMLTRNIDIEDGLVNGAFGTICAIDKSKNDDIKSIFVKFDNANTGKKLMAKTVSMIPESKCSVRITPIEDNLCGKNAVRKQFPFKLGWASTIHKVQGMTTKKVVVSLKKIFQPGMSYVALSRATSLAGLHILNLDVNTIYASQEIEKVLQDMPRFLKVENTENVDGNTVEIVLHNTEGLLPHKEDIKNSEMLLRAHVVCFTETWLNKNSSIPASLLPDFQAHTRNREAAYSPTDAVFNKLSSMARGGVAMFVKKRLKHIQCQLSVENLEYIAINILKPNITLVTVYRPPNYPIRMFSKTLSQILSKIESEMTGPVIIVGDFNDNAFSKTTHFQNLFTQYGYKQLVDKPTTESGTCLDLVLVKGFTKDPKITVWPMYYSFHDVVTVSVTF